MEHTDDMAEIVLALRMAERATRQLGWTQEAKTVNRALAEVVVRWVSEARSRREIPGPVRVDPPAKRTPGKRLTGEDLFPSM